MVKVFTKGDSGLNLKRDREKIMEIKKVLEGCVNCLPFNQAFVTDRAGFIVRQYVKDSLYDRISTRPFLSLIETTLNSGNFLRACVVATYSRLASLRKRSK